MDRHPKQKGIGGRRAFLGGAICGMAGGSMGTTSSAQAFGSAPAEAKLTGLTPEGLPPADSGYTQGILAKGKRLVFVSGQGPDDLNVDMETQIRQTLENIGQVLAAAGASFENVAVLRGYFVHLSRDLPVYRKVRRDYLVKPYPASSCIGTTELAVPGLEVEIEAVAVV